MNIGPVYAGGAEVTGAAEECEVTTTVTVTEEWDELVEDWPELMKS